MSNFTRVVLALACAALTACNQSQPPQAPVTPPPLTLTDELRAKLATADAADGTTDHVIGKCIMCGLHMTGKSEFAVPVGDYSAHLCSAGCQKNFAADPAKALLALQP